MAQSLTKAIIAIVVTGLLGATAFFWYSMRDVFSSLSSYAVSDYHSQIHQSQKLETMIREGRIAAALERIQQDRDRAVVQLGQMRPHIDVSTWRMGRDQYIVDKLDAALRVEVEYRQSNGPTNSKLADQARTVLASYQD